MKYSIILLLTASCFIRSALADLPTLKVGVITPLTGNSAAWGQDVRNSILFANARFGGSRIFIQFEDDHCIANNAVIAAQKLIGQEAIDIGVVACSESMVATAPLFEKNRILTISPVGSGVAISKAGDFIFRMWPSDKVAATVLSQHIARSVKNLGILSEDRGYSSDFSDAFRNASRGSTLIIRNELFSTKTVDFRSLLLNLRSGNSEAIFINTNSEASLVVILQQMKAMGWKVPIYATYFPGSPSFLKSAGALSEGIEFVDAPSVENLLTAEGKKLFEDYKKQYGPPRSSSFAFASTIETFRRIVSLSGTRDLWRREFYNGPFLGIFGRYSFDKNGDIVGVRPVLKKIVRGKAVVIKKPASSPPAKKKA